MPLWPRDVRVTEPCGPGSWGALCPGSGGRRAQFLGAGDTEPNRFSPHHPPPHENKVSLGVALIPVGPVQTLLFWINEPDTTENWSPDYCVLAAPITAPSPSLCQASPALASFHLISLISRVPRAALTPSSYK